MNNDYDVIVIGAGNGGLSAAVALQKAGKKVALFEKHNVPGGCGTSFRRGRFEFEVALHQLSSMGTAEKPGELRQIFKDYGIEKDIEWIQIHDLYNVMLPIGGKVKKVALPTNKDEAIKLLSNVFPEEADGVKAYYEMIWKFAAEIDDFKAKSGESTVAPGILKKYLMKTFFPKKYPTLAKYALMASEDVLNEFFKCTEIKLVLSAYWCFMGMPPKRFPFSILGLCTYIYTTDKPFYLRGGSQVMSVALSEKVKEYGGELFLNTKIEKIIIENGEAKGVIDENGNSYYAKKIISNICPLDTYGELMDQKDIPEKAVEYLSGYTVGISAFGLYIGLDCTPDKINLKESFNLIYDSLDANGDFAMSKKIDATRDPIVFTCYTIDDPKVSPEGTSIISAGVLKYAEEWEKLSPEEYYKTKYDTANVIIDRIEKRFPGLREHIEEIAISTPLTFERYLGHPGGAIYGFEQDLKSSVFFNPTQSFIKNLEFASGWVNTCGFGPNYIYANKVANRMLKEGI